MRVGVRVQVPGAKLVLFLAQCVGEQLIVPLLAIVASKADEVRSKAAYNNTSPNATRRRESILACNASPSFCCDTKINSLSPSATKSGPIKWSGVLKWSVLVL
jgi:hypothetical protein